ncbi:response regulator transcription factor [Chloroflexota bacterium]
MKKTIQILLVDDHQVVRDGLQRMLEQEKDFQVVGQSGESEDTLLKITTLSPDIVMMDIKMSGVDGIELTRQIKQKYPSSNIIMLTLYDQYLNQAMEAGARGYLLKDIKREELSRAIRQVHGGQMVIGESIKSNSPLVNNYQYKENEKEEAFDDLTEEIQMLLTPPVEAGQLIKLTSRAEKELNSRVLQTVGSWREGTITTIILNKAIPLEDIISIISNMPEVETVRKEYLTEEIDPRLLRKSEAIPRQRHKARKTIVVTLKNEISLVDDTGVEDYNPSSSLYISS